MDDDKNTPRSNEVNWQFKPGDTIEPTTTMPLQESDGSISSPPKESETKPQELINDPAPSPSSQKVTPNSTQLDVPDTITAQPKDNLPEPSEDPSSSISWTASEYIDNQKTLTWYLMLGLSAIVITLVVWFLTKDKISAGVIIVGAIVLGVYGARKPRTLNYEISENGLTIGDKHYPFEKFRSFTVIAEGSFSSIAFVPLKRFGALVTIYYDPKDESEIFDILSAQLPVEDHSNDIFDRFLRHIRY